MKIAGLVILMTMTSAAAAGTETGGTPTPEVASAMRKAWADAVGSLMTNVEAGFRIDRRETGETVVPSRITNQSMRQRMAIIPGVTVAVYHVHPKSADPQPSDADRRLADRWRIKVYTMHYAGLYVYDPETKTTERLKERLDWLRK